jgi:hypothetical protein
MNWAKEACNLSNTKARTILSKLYRFMSDPHMLVQSLEINFLKSVPYNKPPYTKYPHLANILQDNPCVPKYNSLRSATIESFLA